MQQATKTIPTHRATRAWTRDQGPGTRDSIPGMLKKGTQSEAERKAVALYYVKQTYSEGHWTPAHTDG